jgi:hypothetical protein
MRTSSLAQQRQHVVAFRIAADERRQLVREIRRRRRLDHHALGRRHARRSAGAAGGLAREIVFQRLQILEQIARALITTRAILVHRAIDDRREARRDRDAVMPRERRRVVAQDARGDVGGAVAVERQASADQLVQQNAGAPDVAARIERAAAQLLGRHVKHGAAHDERIGFLEVRRRHRVLPRQSEIEQLHVTIAAQHDVVRLHIAMDEACCFGGRECRGDLDRDLDRLGERRLTARHPLPQRDPVDELRGDEMLLANLPDIVNGEDIRMIERRRRARLVLEPLAQVLVIANGSGKNFQRDGTLQLAVVREIHLTHPARTNERTDLVTTETRTGLKHLTG